MKKLIILALVAAMVFGTAGTALALHAESISTDLIPQSVAVTMPVQIKIHCTIEMDTSIDKIEYACMNPINNSNFAKEFTWDIHSNLPFWKTASWTDLETHWTVGTKPIDDIITKDRIKVFVADKLPDGNWGPWTQITNPWAGPVIGDADHHQHTEKVKYEIPEINWCDSAGWYTGSLTLDAHQN